MRGEVGFSHDSAASDGSASDFFGTDVDIDEGNVKVTYTLTTPACPLGPIISGQIESLVMDLPGVSEVTSELTFSPPWDPKTMASDDVKMQLGIW